MDTKEEERIVRGLLLRYGFKVALLILLGIAICADVLFGKACAFAILNDLERNELSFTNLMFLVVAVMAFIRLVKIMVALADRIWEMHEDIVYDRKYLLNEDNKYRIIVK